MTDLVEFLWARFDEDEQVASGAIRGPWAVATNGEVYAPSYDREVRLTGRRTTTEHLYVTSDSEGILPSVQEEEAEHIARHDPARVLTEVAAKRAILDHALVYEAKIDGEWACCHEPDEIAAGLCPATPPGAIRLLRLLAAPYASHPDYDPVWGEETR